ncbi:hypothetical protein D3C77_515520 [compost metagenome]
MLNREIDTPSMAELRLFKLPRVVSRIVAAIFDVDPVAPSNCLRYLRRASPPACSTATLPARPSRPNSASMAAWRCVFVSLAVLAFTSSIKSGRSLSDPFACLRRIPRRCTTFAAAPVGLDRFRKLFAIAVPATSALMPAFAMIPACAATVSKDAPASVATGPPFLRVSNSFSMSVFEVLAVMAITSDTRARLADASAAVLACMLNAPMVSVAMSVAVAKSVCDAVARSIRPGSDAIEVWTSMPTIAR